VRIQKIGFPLIFAGLAVFLLPAPALCGQTPSFQEQLSTSWATEFAVIQKQIDRQSALAKSSSASTVSRSVLDPQSRIRDSDRTPLDVVVRRTRALLNDLRKRLPARTVNKFEKELQDIERAGPAQGLAKSSSAASIRLYQKAAGLRRQIALSNPLLDFDTILFVGHLTPLVQPPFYEQHCIEQYLGWNAQGGGGLFKVTGFKSGSPVRINLLQNSTPVSGRFQGTSLAGGAFMSPDLSYSGDTILFAWTRTSESKHAYHIFRVDRDGRNLRQLTDGYTNPDDVRLPDMSQNDFDPCWLPNGRIVFISERRGGYGRCHPIKKPTYTLFSMKSDGSDIYSISYHETNEWHPSVDNNGMILYSRWDYVDRGACIAHHPWICYPDGRDPRSWHGNYPLPFNTIETQGFNGEPDRPIGEFNVRAIPNSNKWIATAAGHHSQSFGDLILIDPTIPDDGKMSQITGITTNNTTWCDYCTTPYGTAWPLSEEYYLCNKGNSIILLDKFGNEDIIYTSPDAGRPIDPIPLRARQKPPVLATATWQGERASRSDHKRATLSVVNVYNGDLSMPANTRIAAMRIIQIFPKPTWLKNDPNIGYAGQSLARMSIGTVPVETDGSVYCEAPVSRSVYFQLLDEQGLAVRSMRSATYVHQGEQLSCAGCHEDKWKAVPPSSPLALRRAPSKIAPEAGGVEPINFHRLVKPVLQARCAPCHTQRAAPPNMSYQSLESYAAFWPSHASEYLCPDIETPIYGGSRFLPGKFGAHFSKLLPYLNSSHYNVALTNDEFRRITLWLDCNSNELGDYFDSTGQRNGKLVWPRIDADQANPQGIELGFVTPSVPARAQRGASELFLMSARGRHVSVANLTGGNLRVELFDARGRMVLSWMAPAGTSRVEDNGRLLRLPQGTYLARALWDGQVIRTAVQFL
jgi:uncharacterized protein (DUF2267 family)